MAADYAQYELKHGVLPMPADYSPSRQVLINSFFNYWWPTYGAILSTVLAALLGYGTYRLAKRLRR
jgi:hypothetical protein